MSKQKPQRGIPADYRGASPEQVAKAIKRYRPKPEPVREPKQDTQRDGVSEPPSQP